MRYGVDLLQPGKAERAVVCEVGSVGSFGRSHVSSALCAGELSSNKEFVGFQDIESQARHLFSVRQLGNGKRQKVESLLSTSRKLDVECSVDRMLG